MRLIMSPDGQVHAMACAKERAALHNSSSIFALLSVQAPMCFQEKRPPLLNAPWRRAMLEVAEQLALEAVRATVP